MSEVVLHRARSVLEVQELTNSESVVAGYERVTEGEMRIVWFSRRAWEEMGCPPEITVTIEPGNSLEDELNAE